MSEEIDMPWNWPVDVNQLEAKAFCNWKTEQLREQGVLSADQDDVIRLPMEDEWYRLRDQAAGETSPHVDDQPFWNSVPLSAEGNPPQGNISLFYYASSCPVNRFQFRDSGFYDVVGNVWQHCETSMAPYEGFRVHPAYDDFTVPTFDNMHAMIKGGSWISTGNEATYHARYAFRRHFYQHAGFRYVRAKASIVPQTETRDHLESDPIVANAISEHYGSVDPSHPMAAVETMFGRYPTILVNKVVNVIEDLKRAGYVSKVQRVLEIGCSAGRGTFELARHFDSVIGFDASTRFIQIGTLLKQEGVVKYSLPEEGDLVSFHKVDFHEDALSELNEVREKVHFQQGDASNIDKTKFNSYDLIVFASNFTQCNAPVKFLQHVHELLNEHGVLVMTTTNDWARTDLKKSAWVGGYKDETIGEVVHCEDMLASYLQPHFVEMKQYKQDIPSLQRQFARIGTVLVSNFTVWQKK